MSARLVLLAVALVFMLAACGGDGDDDEGGEATPPATETAGGAAGSSPEGREIFVANCGGCHTLSDAGTSGTTGPSLDDFAPSRDAVEEQVRNGGGGMPAFEGQLSDEEIETVSDYVAEQAGG